MPTTGMLIAPCRAIMPKTTQPTGPERRDCDTVDGAGAGIARIVQMQSEQSALLREILRENAGVRSLADIPNIELFYNLEEIFAQIAHEGRNYLSPVMGYASLIREAAVPGGDQHQWSERIVSGARMMERYFEQLNLYRTKGMSEVRETKWTQFIEELLDSFSFYNRRGAPVRVIDNTTGTITAHISLLQRLLLHLMRNAEESTRERGAITLEIDTRRTNEGEAQIAFHVTDEGCGIDEAKREFIWKPFFTTKPKHYGLGLSYVAMAAAILGTTVMIESVEGGGSTFSFLLKPVETCWKPEGGSIELT